MTAKRKPSAAKAEKARNDGFQNVANGVGTKIDPRSYSNFKGVRVISQAEIENMYRRSGYARRIIDLPATEMTRQWIEIEGDADGNILKALSELNAKEMFRDLIRCADLYGGALMIVGIDDGLDLEQPLSQESTRNVSFLRVYDRYQVQWTTMDLNSDPTSKFYGQPETYTIMPFGTAGITVANYKVHRSRVIRIDGADLPERLRVGNQGWGDSVYQACYDQLLDLEAAFRSMSSILDDFIQTTITMEGLMDLLSSGEDDAVMKRLMNIDLTRHKINTVLLDKDEQYSKHASSVSGLPEIIDRFCMALSAVRGIPQSKLFGRSPAGLNATGESDIIQFYDDLKARQEEQLLPGLQFVVDQITGSRDFKGGEAENKIIFNPLWQMNDMDTVTMRKTQAETDQIYIANGVVDPDEIAESRFGGDHYSIRTEIKPGLRRPLPEDKEEDV